MLLKSFADGDQRRAAGVSPVRLRVSANITLRTPASEDRAAGACSIFISREIDGSFGLRPRATDSRNRAIPLHVVDPDEARSIGTLRPGLSAALSHGTVLVLPGSVPDLPGAAPEARSRDPGKITTRGRVWRDRSYG